MTLCGDGEAISAVHRPTCSGDGMMFEADGHDLPAAWLNQARRHRSNVDRSRCGHDVPMIDGALAIG